MSDLHRNSRFLRFLRSIRSKTTCVRRAIVALFVAIATILATFMIMPSASMGASQQGEPKQVQTQNGNAENKTAADNKAPAKDESAAQGEAAAKRKAEESKTVEHKNPQPSAKQGGSDAPSAQNVDTAKQPNNSVEGAKKNLNKDAAERAKKEESANKSNRQKRDLGNARAATGSAELPEECTKVGSLAACYKVTYEPKFSKEYKDKISVRGKKFFVEPTFKYARGITGNPKKEFDKNLVTGFDLEKLMISKKEVNNNGLVTIDPQTGKITVYANRWLKSSRYNAYVKVTYSDGSYTTNFKCPVNDKKCVKVTRPQVKLGFSIADIEGTKGDLSLKVYNHQESKDRAEVDETNGVTFTSDDSGKFSKITPIFIDTTSAKKPNLIYHRMICHKDGNSSDYHLDSINGLTLSDSANGGSTGGNKAPTQKQWDPALGDRPDGESADDESFKSEPKVYENDTFAERSQSWITGTPNEAGDFTCKVFAFNDDNVSAGKVAYDSYVKLFNLSIGDNSELQSAFEDPKNAFYKGASKSVRESEKVSEEEFKNSLSDKQTIDWDYKTIKIQVGDDDKLSLNVYPFKGSKTVLTSDNNKISAMLGMELKPYIEATSSADSKNQIALRVLCKGEKKNAAAGGGVASTGGAGSTESGSAVGGSSGDTSGAGSKSEQPSESSQAAKATWSSNPDGLVLSVPEDTAQTRCNEAGDGKCTADKVASQASMEVSIKPTAVGNYQCVVFALKHKALDTFNDAIKNTKADSLTPESIKSALTNATPTAFKENKDFAAFKLNIDSVSNFELPHTGEWNWNLQLGAIAAVMVSVLAAGFVASQNDAYRKLFYERRRC
ncbi:Rib/alpha-like domain-containing protein [Gardnerella greenwoodii]|uniref:Rib/alpha-like domain-containing protein n=1 Tax=Gardnerella greenwoodii TaxID=2914925 RepID=UPI0039708CAB